ncbi:MAG: hypothetical protein PHI06_15105 [Desulfobulbaceae bacterium]|nr:hypothetical protein [Desulfobulbaceae bacterium]
MTNAHLQQGRPNAGNDNLAYLRQRHAQFAARATGVGTNSLGRKKLSRTHEGLVLLRDALINPENLVSGELTAEKRASIEAIRRIVAYRIEEVQTLRVDAFNDACEPLLETAAATEIGRRIGNLRRNDLELRNAATALYEGVPDLLTRVVLTTKDADLETTIRGFLNFPRPDTHPLMQTKPVQL